MIQLIIFSFLPQQILMIPTLHDFPLLQHHNGIGIAYRTQSVSNNEYRSAFHQLIHSFLDQRLRTGIY